MRVIESLICYSFLRIDLHIGTARDLLVPACRSCSGTDRRQAHMNGDGQMIPDDGVEIGWTGVVLLVGCARRFGKWWSHEKRPRALAAAIGFTRGRHLTVLVLNHRRPVGADHRFHQ